MKYIFLIIAAAGLFWGCAGSKVAETTRAVHSSEPNLPENYTLIYSIPMTSLNVSVGAVQVITRRGPYYQYAERFLGISGVPSQDMTRWKIENVEITPYLEADPDHYYLLSTEDTYVTNFFRLSEEGFILPINQRQLPDLKTSVPGRERFHDHPLYTDLSIHPNVVEEMRTVIRRERHDTTYVNVPVMQRQSVTRTLEAKAAEAADFIFELRSNRFKLLSGELDLFPDGKATEAILDEYSRLEQEYISLFTGKVVEIKHDYLFQFTPELASLDYDTERGILFRWSDTSGILPDNDMSGRPVMLELKSELKTLELAGIPAKPVVTKGNNNNTNRLYYRIPDAATVRLTDGNRTIARNRVLVSQYGKVVSLPANFLWTTTE